MPEEYNVQLDNTDGWNRPKLSSKTSPTKLFVQNEMQSNPNELWAANPNEIDYNKSSPVFCGLVNNLDNNNNYEENYGYSDKRVVHKRKRSKSRDFANELEFKTGTMTSPIK